MGERRAECVCVCVRYTWRMAAAPAARTAKTATSAAAPSVVWCCFEQHTLIVEEGGARGGAGAGDAMAVLVRDAIYTG